MDSTNAPKKVQLKQHQGWLREQNNTLVFYIPGLNANQLSGTSMHLCNALRCNTQATIFQPLITYRTTVDKIPYTTPISEQQEQHSEQLALLLTQKHYSTLMLIGHSSGADIALQLGTQYYADTVVCVTPITRWRELGEQRLHTLALSAEDERLREKNFTIENTTYRHEPAFFTDWFSRDIYQSARQYHGRSIFVAAHKDPVAQPRDVQQLALQAQNGTYYSIPGSHRVQPDEAHTLALYLKNHCL